MITKYFAIYDKKSQHYSQLFPAPTFGAAERSFRDLVSQPDSQHSKYPDDFALYYILELDDEEASVTSVASPPQLVTEASALVS